MTIQELIDQLTEMGQPEAEVRLVFQPNYPLQYHPAHIKLINADAQEIIDLGKALEGDTTKDERYEIEIILEELEENPTFILYIMEGLHIGYASKSLWDDEQ